MGRRYNAPVIFCTFLMVAVALALFLWIIDSALGIRANTEDADLCEQAGFVWLSGDGVSEHGCYDLERIEIQ